MRTVTVIGGDGNMGRRYRAILDLLGIRSISAEPGNKEAFEADTDGYIVATPTDTHVSILKMLAMYRKQPVLCEKPISKNLAEVEETLDLHDINLSMVNQYYYLMKFNSYGHTSYDFYNTGKDGLAWDCINIIGLAKSSVALSTKSPIWKCQINGHVIDKGLMDLSYVKMIGHWVTCPTGDPSYIHDAHVKVLSHLGTIKDENSNRHTSSLHINPVSEQG